MTDAVGTGQRSARESPIKSWAAITGGGTVGCARWLATIALVVLAGCSSSKEPPPVAPPPPPPPPASINLTIKGGPDLNPSPTGRPSPVMIDIYQLTSPSAFSQVDFFDLAEQRASALGADVVARKAFSLSPGDEERIEEILPPAVTHIGIMAAYRDIQNANWRTTIAVPKNVATVAVVEAGATGLVTVTTSAVPTPAGAAIKWSNSP